MELKVVTIGRELVIWKGELVALSELTSSDLGRESVHYGKEELVTLLELTSKE